MSCIVLCADIGNKLCAGKGKIKEDPILEFKLGYKGRSISDRTFKLSGFNTIRFVVFLQYSRERDSDLNSKNYGNIDVADCNLLMK